MRDDRRRVEIRTDQARVDAQIEHYEQLKKLRALQEEVGEDGWKDLKDGVDIACDAPRHAIDSVRSGFG